jgi:hypothetical protein
METGRYIDGGPLHGLPIGSGTRLERSGYSGVLGDDGPGSEGGRMRASAPVSSGAAGGWIPTFAPPGIKAAGGWIPTFAPPGIKAAGGRMPASAPVSVSCFGT